MSKFAHIADVHLGAHREPAMQKLELAAFEEAMEKCVEAGVDFLLISGDLFHVGIPDLTIVNSALKKMVDVRRSGIPIYAIYGSHDYTPTGTSVIDILNTAGVLTNVSRWKVDGGKVRLEFSEDAKTGAKIAGISARRIGLESKYYEMLDRESLEAEEGFKVFAFHSGITEFKPATLKEMETVNISNFPRGFNYYAGGHIHRRGVYSAPGYEKVVFPGPLFTGYGKDVEDTARGERRGFYLVDFGESGVRSLDFVPVETFRGVYREYDAKGKNVVEVNKELGALMRGAEVGSKVVVLRVAGELSGGRIADIDFSGLRTGLMERGALYVYLNRYGLATKESASKSIAGEDVAVIEGRLFEKEIGRVKVSQPALNGEKGVSTAVELLRALRHGTKTNESKKEYRERMIRDGMGTLKLKDALEDEGR